MADAALADIRVIDLSQGIAGGYCTKLLADCGAEVIKIEPPGTGERARALGPFPHDIPHPEASGLHLHLNTNKKSVTLDISTPSGQVILRKLLTKADVLVESERPGRLSAYRLSYDDLKQDFPDLIYCSITGFGQTGPYRDYQATSIIALALSGLMYVTGDPDREPLATGGEPAEYFAGIQAWVAILAALALRSRDGGGDHLDVALADAVTPADEYNTGLYTAMGAIRRRFHSRHIFNHPNDIYPCKDGYIVVIPSRQGFPTALPILLEQPDLAEHELFTNGLQRLLRWDEFDALIQPYLQSHTMDDILQRAQELRMPFAPVLNAKTLLENEHLQERGFFVEITHPGGCTLKHTGPPFRCSETPMQPGPAPVLGGDNSAALAELGYDANDLLILHERGVI